MTPIANIITTPTSPPALCRDRKRTRECAFQYQHHLCSKFLLPTFDEDGKVERGGIRNSSFELNIIVQRLSHPVTLKEDEEEKKNNSKEIEKECIKNLVGQLMLQQATIAFYQV